MVCKKKRQLKFLFPFFFNLICARTFYTEEFENAALFLQLGVPSTLIRHEKGAFRKLRHQDNHGIPLSDFFFEH